jgi:predicted NBD/HSP70 family sugar kinase
LTIRTRVDIGLHYLRGALADLTGEIRAKSSARTRASSVSGRVQELTRLADALCTAAGVPRSAITQTVIGTPGRL